MPLPYLGLAPKARQGRGELLISFGRLLPGTPQDQNLPSSKQTFRSTLLHTSAYLCVMPLQYLDLAQRYAKARQGRGGLLISFGRLLPGTPQDQNPPSSKQTFQSTP